MRQLTFTILMLFLYTLVGTVGLRLIEHGRWIDCLYMIVITLTTVGFGETVELSDSGKLFIIVYLVSGLGVFTYCAAQLGQWVVNVQIRSVLEKRRMSKEVEALNNHYIVCGIGRMGGTICQHLAERKRSFVVIDTDEERLLKTCREQGWLYIHGDATDDDVLRRAGIERAKSLAAVLPTDADNVYVVLSAHLLNSKMQIVARASDEKAAEKMQRAGASRVVSPFSSGAIKIARFMLHPSVEDFLEITGTHGNDLELADVHITEESPYIGKKLMETDLRNQGVMVIGIRRANGDRLMPPPGSAVIEVGDCLFAFGSATAVNQMIGESE